MRKLNCSRVVTGDSDVVDTNGEVVPDGEVVENEEDMEQFWVVYGFAMIFMLSIFGTNGYLMQSVIEEKETRVVEILISSLRPLHLLAGKILSDGVVRRCSNRCVDWDGLSVGAICEHHADNLPAQLTVLARCYRSIVRRMS